MKQDVIAALYDYDDEDAAFIVKLSPDRYLDIFNKLDSYPIRKRDINQDVINYIEDCSSDIPLSKKLKIEIKVKNESQNADLEQRTQKGMRNYFAYTLAFHKKSSRDMINTSIIYICIFVVLTIGTFRFESIRLDFNKMFLNTILEGLSIGSWVFLWEAIAGLAIKNKKNQFLIRTYKRLLRSEIVFVNGQAVEEPSGARPRQDSVVSPRMPATLSVG